MDISEVECCKCKEKIKESGWVHNVVDKTYTCLKCWNKEK
jgi:hypothetical protein